MGVCVCVCVCVWEKRQTNARLGSRFHHGGGCLVAEDRGLVCHESQQAVRILTPIVQHHLDGRSKAVKELWTFYLSVSFLFIQPFDCDSEYGKV